MLRAKFLFIAAIFTMAALAFTGCQQPNNEPSPKPDPVPVSSVAINSFYKPLTMTVGNTPIQIEWTVLPDNATDKAVTWSVTPAGVITVVDGLVTAVSEGTATITVKTQDGGKTDT